MTGTSTSYESPIGLHLSTGSDGAQRAVAASLVVALCTFVMPSFVPQLRVQTLTTARDASPIQAGGVSRSVEPGSWLDPVARILLSRLSSPLSLQDINRIRQAVLAVLPDSALDLAVSDDPDEGTTLLVLNVQSNEPDENRRDAAEGHFYTIVDGDRQLAHILASMVVAFH
jgi:hypothetical protein